MKVNMKIKVLRVILIVLICINCIIIFNFSEQNGEESRGISRKVTTTILNVVETKEEPITEETQLEIDHAEYIIRKLAHFSIYTCLGIILMSLASTSNFTVKKKLIICILAGMIYASLDEFHQKFTPGRTPLVGDVIIDTVGVTMGCLLVVGTIYVYKKVSKRKINT